MMNMHPYQKYKEKLEKEYSKSVEEVIRKLYIGRDEGPSVTARELGIPRQAVLHFIHEYDLRNEKHENMVKHNKLKL
ncbi:hypothetical protein [Planomicrobium sp. Y74]|uniref:hypothetical protein n=1 Tax=Planomicrobium sp. Y74 TaxID=2478977 RepID=UPI002570967C|nr:hypothetical protein [Planomicrobium sp. Y74]